MKTEKLASSVFAGTLIALCIINTSHAQQNHTPPGYIIVDQETIDADAAKNFSACNAPTMVPFHPSILVRTTTVDVLDGPRPNRVIVLKFESVAAARAWFDSPAHTACDEFKHKAVREKSFLVEGLAQ